LKAKPDTTRKELRDEWGLTFKKTLRAAEQTRADVRLERALWQGR
jgi:hypothetical protein